LQISRVYVACFEGLRMGVNIPTSGSIPYGAAEFGWYCERYLGIRPTSPLRIWFTFSHIPLGELLNCAYKFPPQVQFRMARPNLDGTARGTSGCRPSSLLRIRFKFSHIPLGELLSCAYIFSPPVRCRTAQLNSDGTARGTCGCRPSSL